MVPITPARISVTNDRTAGFADTIADECGDGIEIVAQQPADFTPDLGLEVMEAILQANDDIDAVYTLLKGLDLDPELAAAIDDPEWDDAIDRSMQDAIDLVGDDVGLPILALDTRSGRAGFSGPVLAGLPERDDALALWDGLVLVAGTPEFWELKRTRTGPPTPPPESALAS